MQSYYDELGVSSSATADEISAAFRRMAKQYHPDLNAGREQQSLSLFVRAQKAFEILSNPELRARYDAMIGVQEEQHDQQDDHWGTPQTATAAQLQPLEEFEIDRSALEPAIWLKPRFRIDPELRRALYYLIAFVVLAFLIVMFASCSAMHPPGVKAARLSSSTALSSQAPLSSRATLWLRIVKLQPGFIGNIGEHTRRENDLVVFDPAV